MHDHDKSKAQLIAELNELRHQVGKLQGGENRYQALYKYSMDGVLHTTTKGDILYANPAACDLLGYSEAELQAGGRKLIVDLSDPRLSMLLEDREKTGRFKGELTLIRRNGAKIEVEISSVSFTAEDGSIQTAMFFRDVSEQNQVSQALRESEERFRAIVTSMDDFIFTLDRNNRFTGVFGNFIERLQVGNEYFLGRTVADLLGENPSIDYVKLYERVWAGEKIVFESNYMVGPERVYFQTALTPLVGDDDELYGIVGVGRDITGIKRAEQALRESETQLRTLFDLLPVGVSVWNSEQQLEEINKSLERILSVEREKLFQGEYWNRKLLRPDGSPMASEEFPSIRASKENRSLYNIETGMVTESGEVVWMEVSAAPLPDNRMVVVTTDITERKEREKHILEDQRLRSLGLLAGGIAHDINNFLTPIKMNLDMFRIIRADDKRGFEYLDLADNATKKIEAIVQEMLIFAGKRRPQLGEVDLNSLISGLLTLLQSSLPKSSRIHLDLTARRLPMKGDRGQLEQVLMNLILNASEALEGQTGQIRVITRRQPWDEGGEVAVLVVQDSGTGISPENLNQIFDPFFTTKITGRGLGLSAVRGIIQAHEGEIEVVSELGEGTTFTITLPLSPDGFRPAPVVESFPGIVDPLEGKWLVVEDESILRESAIKVLRAMGVETLEAVDGLEGLEMVKKYSAELTGVLLDITMPNLNGREVFERLREAYPDLPVVLMSGYSQVQVRDLLTQPRVAFLAKPFKFSELGEAMISVVNQVHNG